jgi:hypothetical protein
MGRPAVISSGCLALALALCGCAYHLGPTGGHRARELSIQVNPFANKTLEPRLGEAITGSLRKNLQQDGTYQLNTRDGGDIILTGTILTFDRSQLAFQPGDVLTPRDYALRITAQIVARERTGGRVILDTQVQGQTTIRVGADLTSAERQAIPLAADDLARRATSLLVDGTW